MNIAKWKPGAFPASSRGLQPAFEFEPDAGGRGAEARDFYIPKVAVRYSHAHIHPSWHSLATSRQSNTNKVAVQRTNLTHFASLFAESNLLNEGVRYSY
jgi:hypothetical protein